MPQDCSESREYSWTSSPWARSGAAGARSGAMIKVAAPVRPSGASAMSRCTPSGGTRPGSGSGAGTGPGSGSWAGSRAGSPPESSPGSQPPASSPSSRIRVPAGSTVSSEGGSDPAHHTSTGGNSRCAASRSASARCPRTACGVSQSTPSSRSTAATVASGTRTVTSSAGW